jgi:hypothetical protein
MNPYLIVTVFYYVLILLNKDSSLDSKLRDATEKKILSLMKITTNFRERDVLIYCYNSYLKSRLLDTTIDINLEKNLLNKFKFPDDNKEVQDMMYQIQDIENHINLRNRYKTLKITINSEKYKSWLTNDNLHLERYFITPLRNYVWNENIVKYDKYNPPLEVSPYIEIFNQMYKRRHYNRRLVWNFEKGTSIIKLKLGGKYYNFLLANPQLFLILLFRRKELLTAEDISKELGIGLSSVARILNSLLNAKLIKRVNGFNNDDPKMKLYINKEFSYNEEYISLVELYKPQSTVIDNDELETVSAIGKVKLVMASIVRNMKLRLNLYDDNLYSIVKDDLLFELDKDTYEEAINKCIKGYYITKTVIDDRVKYSYLEVEETNDE